MQYAIFETKLGWMGVLAGGYGLLRIALPSASRKEAAAQMGRETVTATFSPGHFESLIYRFNRYFNGEEVSFPDKLDLSAATPFERAVWRITSLIPYGEIRSYRWVAEGLGDRRTARAVGQALGKNPLPIVIPCHRVIGSNGNLTGFGGGIQMKKALLEMERVRL